MDIERINELSYIFAAKQAERLQQGEEQYGPLAFLDNDVLAELEDELVDVANWAGLLWIKIQLIKEAASESESTSRGSQAEQ